MLRSKGNLQLLNSFEDFLFCYGVRNVNSESFRSDDYQFLQKSKTPTLHFQPSLPRLPIPDLNRTCERYLRAQKPLRTTEQMIALEKKVHQFQTNEGLHLQKELKHTDAKNKHTSYITAPWFEMYLKDRKPIPINYNPFLVFTNDSNSDYNKQLIRATNLLISSLRFMKSLRANYLEPEVYHLNPKKSNTDFFRLITSSLPPSVSWYGAYLLKAYPLDMSQYKNLFCTTRIPEHGMDKICYEPSSRHIIVLRNGHFYKMDVLDESGFIYNPKTLYSCLKYILDDDKKSAEFPVGLLTTENRDVWANARKHLEYIGNKHILDTIDSAIFCLVLENSKSSADYKTLIQQYLHSDGTSRWFDKSFSLIVNSDGIAGLNFEHSWGDGVAVLRYFNDIYQDSTQKPQIHPHTKCTNVTSAKYVSPLDFNLDDTSKQNISKAKENYSNTCNSLSVEVFEFLQFGRNLCKVHNISPDALMQLAFQVAQYKLKRIAVPTYESCSTAAFKHGRTETVRPCTIETQAFCEALASQDRPNNAVLLKMIKDCSAIHGNLIKDAAMGQGFDRHLFALNIFAQKNGKIPEIFLDDLFKDFNRYILSTSTLSSDVVMLGAFGPVERNGYGIGYTIRNDRLGAIVTSYKNNSDGKGYIKCLEGALNDLYKILS